MHSKLLKRVTWVLLLTCLIVSCETPAIKPWSLHKDLGLTRDKDQIVKTWEDAHRYICVSPDDAKLIADRLLQCEIDEENK